MKLIIGLGNPGKQYEKTRHNAGFLALDYFLKDIDGINCQGKFEAQICEVHLTSPSPSFVRRGIEKVFFVKPQRFMNLSGEVVREICQFYKVDPKTDILVIHDDKDLKLGDIRVATNSSAGGHNGVQNIIDELATQEFRRVRIGVESRSEDSQIPTRDFVLMPFRDEELKVLDDDVFVRVKAEIEKFIGQ